MLLRLAALLVDHRRWILSIVALTTTAAALLAVRIRFDFTPQALFAGQGELLAFSEQVKETFDHAENAVLVVQQADGEDDLLTPAALEWHVALCRRLAELPAVERIDALGTLRMPRMRLFSSSLMYVPVIREDRFDAAASALVRRKVAAQPLLEGVLVSQDRRVAVIVLYLDPSRKDFEHIRAVIDSVRGVLREVEPPPEFSAFVGGLPAMRATIIDSLRADQTTIIPLCAVLFTVVQLIIFRSWGAVLVSSCAVGVGLAWTLAALVLLDQSLTIISNVLPILLMIVGVSSCVHFLNGYAEQLEISPHDYRRALLATIDHLTLACLLTCLTTALGFLSLLAARSELLGAMGWQAALGILLFFIATVVICSTMLPIYRPRRTSDAHDPQCQPSPLANLAWAAGEWATNHAGTVCLVGAAIIVAAAWLGSQAVVDSRLVETFDDDHPDVAQMRLIEDKLGGFFPMEIVLTAETPHWYLMPDAWRRLAKLQQHAANQPDVLMVRSPADLYAQVDQQLPGGGRLAELAERDADGLAGRLREIQRLQDRFARSGGIRRFTTADGRQVRMLLRLGDFGTRGGLQLAESLQGKLTELFPSSSGIQARVTGEAYVAAVALNGFIRDLLFSLLGVSALIFLVIGVMLRSPRLALLSIAPNVAPLVVTLGYLQLRGYVLNMGNVIVFAISLGVAVDDTIHFLARFRVEARDEPDVLAAIRRTCRGTGRAVLMTTLLIVAGLTILLLSSFVPTRRFAELATVTMISALLGDLLILPALLKLFWRPQQAPLKEPPLLISAAHQAPSCD